MGIGRWFIRTSPANAVVTVHSTTVVSMGGVVRAQIPMYVARELLPHEHDRHTLNSYMCTAMGVVRAQIQTYIARELLPHEKSLGHRIAHPPPNNPLLRWLTQLRFLQSACGHRSKQLAFISSSHFYRDSISHYAWFGGKANTKGTSGAAK